MASYGYSANGTPLREDGSPINFGGNKADYDKYLETEADRKEYNQSTYNDRVNAQGSGSYYPSYDDYQSGSRYEGGSSGGGGGGSSRYDRLLQQAINENVKRLEGQKGGIRNQYGNIAQQQYALYKQGQKNMPGIVGGRSDGDIASLQLRESANYQNSVSDTLLEQEKALSGIDSAIGQVKAEGSAQMAQQRALEAEKAAERAYNMQMQEQERRWREQQDALSFNRQKEMAGYNSSLAMQERAKALALENQYKTEGNSQSLTNDLAGDDQNKIAQTLKNMGYNSTTIDLLMNSGRWRDVLGGAF